MTLPPRDRYAGREQAYVKHHFLAGYIETLVHKVAASYDEIVYVDGFSGPWMSADEDFADTSFGIALGALRAAKATWARHGRSIRMKSVLVEKSVGACAALSQLQPKYPDIEIKPIRADFRECIDTILAEIPSSAFAFVLIDPKGWRIPMVRIASLLRRSNSEVLFNFMFEFINRAASMPSPVTIAGLDELLTVDGWRERLASASALSTGEARSAARKAVLIDAFRATLKMLGGFEYVAEVPVMRPLDNRPIYSLIYGTRSATGIEVFRDCQAKTSSEQDAVRGEMKVSTASDASGQGEMFVTLSGLAPDRTAALLAEEQMNAERALLAITPAAPGSILWERLWPKVLELHVIRKTEINQIAARLRAEGRLLFPDWEKGRRVPQKGYRVQRPAA